jgi:HSF-type DNA-binding
MSLFLLSPFLSPISTMTTSSNTPTSTLSNDAAALFWQQQFQQANAARAPAAAFNTATAQALLRHHEDQLRATRILLQQRQLDEFMTSRATSASSPHASRSSSILSQGPSSSLFNLTGAAALAAAGNRDTLAELAAQAVRRASSAASAPSVMEAAAQVAAEDEEDEEDASEDEDYFKAYAQKESSGVDNPSEADSEDGKAGNESFPHKLYRMLHECSLNPRDGKIVSFLPSGRGFTIHKPKDFVAEIMPRYFTTRRIASFQRQLNLYGFRRISEGKEKGAYFHKDFLKGKRTRIQKIKRKSTASRPSGSSFAQRFSAAPLQFPTVAPSSAAARMYGQGFLGSAQAGAPVNKEMLLARMAAASRAPTATDAASLLEMARRGILMNLPTGVGASHQDFLRGAAASLLFANGNTNIGPF